MLALVLGYSYLTAPTEEELRGEQEAIEQADLESSQQADELDQAQISGTSQISADINKIVSDSILSIEMLKLRDEFGQFAEATIGKPLVTELKSDKLTLELSSKGAMPVRATLKSTTDNENHVRNYAPAKGELIQLFDPQKSSINILFDIKGIGRLNSSDLYFELTSSTSNSLTYTAKASNGGMLEITHTIDGYQVQTAVAFIGLQGIVEERQYLDWSAAGLRNEKGLSWERQHTGIFYREEGKGRNYLSEGRNDEETLETELEWMAFKQDFFSALVSKEEGFEIGSKLENILLEGDTVNTLYFHANLPMDADVSGNRMEQKLGFYFGPNKLDELNNTELGEVGRIIDYGWGVFGWVNRNAILPIYDFLYGRIDSAGLIILIITLIIKMFLFPITWKNFLSQAKMKVIRPDVEAINEKHKDDATARQQATMELYRKTGVNPMAGCLPALLQMPILYAMFRFFPANIDLRGESFLWADDLAAYDSVIDLPLNIPFYGDHISGFTVLMAISIFVYMKMTSAGQPPQPKQPGMPNMKVIQNIIPFTMLIFFNGFASGLCLYYFAANIVSIAQMLVIKKYFINEESLKAEIEAYSAKPKKKSSFQQRLEEMQKEQARKTKEIKSKRKK